MKTKNIFFKTAAAIIFSGVCFCMLPGCLYFIYTYVPEDVTFSLSSKNVVLTQNAAGGYKMVLNVRNLQLLWESNSDNQTGYVYVDSFDALWMKRFGLNEVDALLMYRNPEDNDTAWFCSKAQSFTVDYSESGYAFILDVELLTDEGFVPEELSLATLVLNRSCPSGDCLSDLVVNGYCIAPYANLQEVDLSGADLTGANLANTDLRGANLSGADLSGANMDYVNLTDVNLSNANLSGSSLYRVDFSRADLINANLNSAGLRYADLTDADLSGVDLRGADLSGAILNGTNLSGVIWK